MRRDFLWPFPTCRINEFITQENFVAFLGPTTHWSSCNTDLQWHQLIFSSIPWEKKGLTLFTFCCATGVKSAIKCGTTLKQECFIPSFKIIFFYFNLHTFKYTHYIAWQLSQMTKSGHSANYQLLTWVAVCQKRTNRQQNLWNSQSRAPVVFQDIQTDDSLTVDVAVINSGTESNLESQCERESGSAAQGCCPSSSSSSARGTPGSAELPHIFWNTII